MASVVSIIAADPQSSTLFKHDDEDPPQSTADAGKAAEMGMLINEVDDTKCDIEGELTIPESTHSFLFTEPVTSLPFLFSLYIVVMSYGCLIIALIDNLAHNDTPENVEISVRIAQYMAILIALLMEEEIPTALHLLKRISKQHLQSKFPTSCYWRFVASSLLRFSLGYLFLGNVLLILIQANNVLEIFYDVLALQFLQQLDDIAFTVSKFEVLGKRMYLATMTPFFTTGFEKQDRFDTKKNIKYFLKGVYLLNLFLFLALMIRVSVKQVRGDYQCPSYTVRIGKGEEVWQEAYVVHPANSVQYAPGTIEVRNLVFSNFNGVYKMDETGRTREGRPIYVEQSKADGLSQFDTSVPTFDTSVQPYVQMDPVKPAEIIYCNGRWLLVHEYIKKHEKEENSDCGSWLLRSEPYDGFDLGGAGGVWQIWEGEIGSTYVSLSCNLCEDNSDCNLNGECNEDGECECNEGEGWVYLGTHCEVKLKDSCRNITSSGGELGDKKVVWSVGADTASESLVGKAGVFQEYSRPVYSYVTGLNEQNAPTRDDNLALIYSGSRYFIMNLAQVKNNATSTYWQWQSKNYHGFWSGAYHPSISFLISEPTESDTPVGVDFFWVGEQDEMFGPWGALYPASEFAGHGLFRCDVPTLKTCNFCSKGITVDPTFIIEVPQSNDTSCGALAAYAPYLTWTEEDDDIAKICDSVLLGEELCCPGELAGGDNATILDNTTAETPTN